MSNHRKREEERRRQQRRKNILTAVVVGIVSIALLGLAVWGIATATDNTGGAKAWCDGCSGKIPVASCHCHRNCGNNNCKCHLTH